LSSFCRHNRFISECPICAKGTVLDPKRKTERRSRSTTGGTRTSTRRATGSPGAKTSRGPYASAGPYGSRELRLERVPGGLRLASWLGGQLERSAPVLEEQDLPALLAAAIEKELFSGAEASSLGEVLGGVASDSATANLGDRRHGRSAGRSGELRDELRVEPLEGGQLRVARWVMRPNRGWELQEAPVLLPAKRFAQAFADAARLGVLAPGQPTA
jgi:hypothetical protein